jgi:phage-related protein
MTKAKLEIYFFRQASGKEPVRDLLKSLPPLERKFIGEDLKTVQWGWPIGMPLVRSLGGGLWEVRTNLPKRILRIIFCTRDNNIVLLHGFIKKTQKTQSEDIKLAKRRMAKLRGDI